MKTILSKIRPKSHWDLSQAFVAFVLAGLCLATFGRLLWAYTQDGYVHTVSGEVDYPSTVVWEWITDNEKRPRWQVGLYDMATYSGSPEEIASTRVAFLIEDGARWQALETTLESIEGTKFRTRQVYETGSRDVIIELTQQSPCKTIVTIIERGKIKEFWPRFSYFLRSGDDKTRLENSLSELNRWIGGEDQGCKP